MLVIKTDTLVEFQTESVVDETTLITDIVQRFSKDGYLAEYFKVTISNPSNNEIFAKITIVDNMNKVKFKLNQYKEYIINDLENATYTLDEFSFTLQNDYTKTFLFYVSNPDIGDKITKTINFKFNNDATETYLFPTSITFMKIDETISCSMDLSQSLQPCRNQTGATSRWLEGTISNVPESFLPNHQNLIYSTDCNTIFLNGPNPLTNVNSVQNSVLFIQKSDNSLTFKIFPVAVPGTGTAPAISAGQYTAFGGTWNTVANYAKYLMFNYSLV